MSIAVEIAELEERIAEFGPQAFLVTVRDEGTPHVVSVVVRLEAERLRVGAGARTRANLVARPAATLLWPPPAECAYSLIVDATADPAAGDDESVALSVSSAVLHRMAGAPGDGPTCLPVTSA